MNSLIRCNIIPDGVEWEVVRDGKTIIKDIAKNILFAKNSAEQKVTDIFESEKICTKTLMGFGDKQLYLMRSTK